MLVSADGVGGLPQTFEQSGAEGGALGQQIGLYASSRNGQQIRRALQLGQQVGLGTCSRDGQQVRRALQGDIRPPVSQLDAAEQILPLPAEPRAHQAVGQRLQCRLRHAIILCRQLRFA